MSEASRHPALVEFDEDQLRITVQRAELAARIDRYAGHDGTHATVVPQLSLIKATRVDQPVHVLHRAAVCIVVQGSKWVLLNNELCVYDAATCLVVSHDLPLTGQVIAASPDVPYLALRLDLDLEEIAALSREIGDHPVADHPVASRGIYAQEAGAMLLGAVLRLVKLIESPADAAVLAPLVTREIFYRLLTSSAGGGLRQMARTDSVGRRVARAIAWVRERRDRPILLRDMARDLRMGVSSLRRHFKAVTAMTPLQYQSRLRLQEARRVLLIDGIDAAQAGRRVGYQSTARFARESGCLFGSAPARDAKHLRERQLTAGSAA